ncbi:LCP family protein [Nocardia sp. CA2R105]|uniref:LCP family protein n=1 Tax=Nocardia coffeae TaxID=2873381 RepID=UPI001CA74849|nr:LCP family protein [Nocardia coffeae]MBY8858404.1 LCP family protein [Nocardia coffeae]
MSSEGGHRRKEPDGPSTERLPHGTQPRLSRVAKARASRADRARTAPPARESRSQARESELRASQSDESKTEEAQPDPDAATTLLRPRRHTRRPARRQRTPKAVVVGRTLIALVSVLVLVGTGAAWRIYDHAVKGVITSNAISDGPKSVGKDQNILLMGLDSRKDEHGNPLPQAMYNALHAGDNDNGGMNSNVLMLIHIPGDGSKSTAISIPRDDYVTLDPAACDGDLCKGKIKEAYGRTYGAVLGKQAQGDPDAETKARDAGRKAELKTVSKFLGDVPIDHFVEITMAAFFEIAEQVQPITVCLNENTHDTFSGARFVKGQQQINASQAMAFVRQRRDPDESLNFTDMDRTRRQQAFVVSLVAKLKTSGTLSSPTTLMGLLKVAQQNMAVDSGLDLGKFAGQASSLMGGGLTLYTLPVKDFKVIDGEDTSIVDLDLIHSYVKNLLYPPKPGAASTSASASPATTNIPSATGVTANVVNSSGKNGLGGSLGKALAGRGFTQGVASTGYTRSSSTLLYGSGAEQAATALAGQLGLTATKSSAINAQSIQLTVGTELAASSSITSMAGTSSDDSSETPTSTTPPPPPVSATNIGTNSPAPTDMSSMKGSGIPCVK